MLREFPSEKINVTKNVLIFLSRAPTHHSFTLNSQFLYELKYKVCLSKTVCMIFHLLKQGRIQRFLKGGALYVGHCGWPAKKILSFRWSKKAEVTLETISFWQNISISIFKFSPFLSIKSYQFFKIAHTAVNEKRKTEKSWTLYYNRLFYKAL